MMYLSPGQLPPAMAPYWGEFLTLSGNAWYPRTGRPWALDNGSYSGAFTPDAFTGRLDRLHPYRGTCLFVVAPDVVGNALATLDAARYWLPRITAAGYPAAFVAQDGQEDHPLPPPELWRFLFIGGTTRWKMSQAARSVANRASAAGRLVHVGRVNSQKRIHYAARHLHAFSADGTSLVISPRQMYPRLDKALREVNQWR